MMSANLADVIYGWYLRACLARREPYFSLIISPMNGKKGLVFVKLVLPEHSLKHLDASIQIFAQGLRFLPKFDKAKCLGWFSVSRFDYNGA